MNKQPYYFEIKDLITQFISAFDDVVISRYNKSRVIQDKIEVRYAYAPKERVLHDLINKSQHITVPAVAVSIGGVSRDESRVFNKITGSYSESPDLTSEVSDLLPSPVPVNVSVNMSIITRFQTDMDQILSNFIPYTNPYIVISWKVPTDFVQGRTEEIRSEVEWSGDISLSYPTDLTPQSPYRVTADTSFTIKGWLFPDNSKQDGKRIFYIDTRFIPVTGFEYM